MSRKWCQLFMHPKSISETKSGKEKERKNCVLSKYWTSLVPDCPPRLRFAPLSEHPPLFAASNAPGTTLFAPNFNSFNTFCRVFTENEISMGVWGTGTNQVSGVVLKKWEKRERRNGRGKIRLGREIKMFSPFLSRHWKLEIIESKISVCGICCFYFNKRPIVKSSWDIFRSASS